MVSRVGSSQLPAATVESDVDLQVPRPVAERGQRVVEQWVDHLASGWRHEPAAHREADRQRLALLDDAPAQPAHEPRAVGGERDPDRRPDAQQQERDAGDEQRR